MNNDRTPTSSGDTSDTESGARSDGPGTELRTPLQQEIDRLIEIRDDTGRISCPDYEESLERLGRSITPGAVGGLRKQVNKIKAAAPYPSKLFDLDEAGFIALARAATLEGFHTDWVAPRHRDLSYPSFFRWIHANVDPGLLALVQPGRKGMRSFRKAVLSCLWCCEKFGEAWQTDVVTLDFKAIPPGRGHRNPVKVHLIGIIDDATRLIVGWGVVYGIDNRGVRASDVAGVFIGAMHRWGIPEQIVMDNGAEFDNSVITRLLTLSGTPCRLTPRYRGDSKGKIERFNLSVHGWFARQFTTWTGGPDSAARYSLEGNSHKNAPTHKEVMDMLRHWIDDRYNTKKIHSGHGLTPIAARDADPTELRELELHRVLHLAPVHNLTRKDQFVEVTTSGVKYDNRYWSCLDPHTPGRGRLSGVQSLAREIGKRHGVQVRPVNGDDTIIGIYDVDDKFVCIATRMDLITSDIKMQNRSVNDANLRDGGQLLAAAFDELAAEFPEPDEADDTNDRRNAVTVSAQIADLLNTESRLVRPSSDKVIDANGDTLHCRVITVEDSEVRDIDIDTAIRILLLWTETEIHEAYRVRTHRQELDYIPTQVAARIIDRATGEVTQHIVIAFPTN